MKGSRLAESGPRPSCADTSRRVSRADTSWVWQVWPREPARARSPTRRYLRLATGDCSVEWHKSWDGASPCVPLVQRLMWLCRGWGQAERVRGDGAGGVELAWSRWPSGATPGSRPRPSPTVLAPARAPAPVHSPETAVLADVFFSELTELTLTERSTHGDAGLLEERKVGRCSLPHYFARRNPHIRYPFKRV